jgi:hypothetical protein
MARPEDEKTFEICPFCRHAAHGGGDECAAGVSHNDGKRWHRCLCLAREGAGNACPPLMDCRGGDLGYADLYYLQQGHSLVRANQVITPADLLAADNGRIVGYRSRFADTMLRCLDHGPHQPASLDWIPVTASDVETGPRRTCSYAGCGVDVLTVKPAPTTPCDEDMPCDWEGSGEPCQRHEREQAHAEGDHTLCEMEPTCEVTYPSDMLRNTVLYRAIPGSKNMLRELERRAEARGRAQRSPSESLGCAGEE